MNKQFVRAAVLGAVLAGSVASTKTYLGEDGGFQHELILIHMLAFSAWFGCSVWVSFIAGLIMFKNLPRHTFGRLQAKLFPAYFLFSAVMIGIAMVTSNALGWGFKALGCIMGTVLINMIYLEPETTRVMFERHKVERRLGTGHEVGILKPKDPAKANDPELKKLSKQFGMLHGLSTLFNLGALGVGCFWINFCTQQMISR
jgi:hypothetical protein